MRRMAVVVLLLLGLAGCSDDAGTEAADAVDPVDAGPLENATALPAPEPVLSVVAVEFDGNLGTGFYACEYQTTGVCQGQRVVADETDLYLERPGETLVAAALTLTWSATSPATEVLGFGLMRMGGNNTMVDEVEGMSPLTIDATGLDLLLGEDDVVHAYIYNARGGFYQPPVGGYASVDEDFTLEGTLTMRSAT